ncbi:PIN domain-containing protein [Akkermansiaceae bacterium]|nr:PIN domain-containing protein [Akkermansiaceae bacterium]MDB4538233.1 PIN domain-containing protein [Akkermansiaceae bacterium]
MSKLVDSSAWIDFMRGGEEARPDVAAALRNGSAAMTEPVWAELWSGSRSKREDDFLIGLKSSCLWLECDRECWDGSYDLRRKAIRKGLNCPLADVLIVACALRHGAELCHVDKHMTALLEL